MYRSATVLVVDDDIFVRRSMIRVIRNILEGLEFLEARDGEEAIAVLARQDVHLVILDLMMPRVDGFGVLEWLRDRPELADLPVIVNSANGDWEIMHRAFSLGARDYFLKPLTLQQMSLFLPFKIRNALALYENTRMLRRRDEEMRKELRIAKAYQQALLPSCGEDGERRSSCAYRYVPSIELGGDFFDYLWNERDRCWVSILLDITGHGVAAAMGTGMAKILFRDALQHTTNPGKILERMNDALFGYFGDNSLLTFTALVGRVQQGDVEVASAGHPWPLWYRAAQGVVEPVRITGFPLGYFPHRSYEVFSYCVEPRDSIILATDGLAERYGTLEGWCEAVGELLSPPGFSGGGAWDILDRLSEEFWPGGTGKENASDDATLVVCYWPEEDFL